MSVQLVALCSEDEERNGMGEEWFKGNTYLQLSVPVYKNREERENFQPSRIVCLRGEGKQTKMEEVRLTEWRDDGGQRAFTSCRVYSIRHIVPVQIVRWEGYQVSGHHKFHFPFLIISDINGHVIFKAFDEKNPFVG
ncbi:hypothetical protein BT69DRAFT_997295 [Atractiella rhizophila]|nr:hypothetical protein BT69DRAFT_997295 [Atractiella rhizophila]